MSSTVKWMAERKRGSVSLRSGYEATRLLELQEYLLSIKAIPRREVKQNPNHIGQHDTWPMNQSSDVLLRYCSPRAKTL